jgi:hypothetical protein
MAKDGRARQAGWLSAAVRMLLGTATLLTPSG